MTGPNISSLIVIDLGSLVWIIVGRTKYPVESNHLAVLLRLGNIVSNLPECRLAAMDDESTALKRPPRTRAYITGPTKFSHLSEGPTLIFAVSSKSICLNWGHTDDAT